MTKIFVTIIVGMIGLLAQTPQEPIDVIVQKPAAIVEVQPNMYHLGKVPDNKIHHFSFTLINHSDEMMKIDRITTTCGCTTTDKEFEEVLPGKSTKLNIAFDPHGRKGFARWEILIYTNLKNMPVVLAPFDVEILRDGMVSHDAVSFGEFQRGNLVEQEIWVAPPENPDFEIKKVEILIPEMEQDCFDISFTRCTYSGFYPGERPAYQIKFKAKQDIPYGRLEGIVRITSTIKEHETIELPFLAKVSGNIGVRPDYVPMGTFASGEHVMRRIMIFHREGQSFQILKIESDVSFINMGFVPIIEDQYYQIIVTVKKDVQLPLGEFRGRIVVYTSYPDMPKIVLPLQGIVIERN